MSYIGYVPAAKPLTSADITDSVVTSAKIANGTIAIADLSATGTPSSTTFLRGDNAWGEAGAAAGQVIQVVTATDSTQRGTTSTSFVTASNSLSATITPSSSSNKIFILVSSGFATPESSEGYATIYRGATNLGNGTSGMTAISASTGDSMAMSYLDSPATTSATTYQVYIRGTSTNPSTSLNWNSTKGSITLFEIKG